MKLNAFVAALAVAATSVVAVPAVAQTYSQGHIQLARSVGVAPGTLTTAQLIELDQAQSEGGAAGRAKAEYILQSAGAERISTSNAEDRGRAILLERAQHENNEFLIDQLKKDVANNTASDLGSVSPGKAQLAASLNVDPAEFTTAELVALKTRLDFADNSK
ncbi:hypothetical protein [Oceaniglobus trochenteri]|uniref:hypothetical protein n=1 Tax=Oceaniglobus trochenteri TaxID=2763260 RepID=UPI001CFFA5EE|nr:hypothetical protein [Oceaniglobus trochenteri]